MPNMQWNEPPEMQIDIKNTYRVKMETTKGLIELDLYPEYAPRTVNNFVFLVQQGYYDGVSFHRVIDNFVIQGGSPDGSPAGNAGYTIPAEFSNVKHMPGTLAMARGGDPNSASCQFYICLTQLEDLDGKYTIFGQTVEGMDVVLKIGKAPTKEGTESPLEPITMIRLLEQGKEPAESTD